MSENEDVEFEAENNEPPKGGDAEKKVARITSELEACRAEKQEYRDGWQRAKADYVNLLRRFDEEKAGERTRGVVAAAEALLPAFDAIERAKEHGEVPEGFAAIVRQLESAFASLGLVPVGEVGERFDPAIHEALGTDATGEGEKDDTVTSVLEKGWKIGESVLRPAKVRVAQHR